MVIFRYTFHIQPGSFQHISTSFAQQCKPCGNQRMRLERIRETGSGQRSTAGCKSRSNQCRLCASLEHIRRTAMQNNPCIDMQSASYLRYGRGSKCRNQKQEQKQEQTDRREVTCSSRTTRDSDLMNVSLALSAPRVEVATFHFIMITVFLFYASFIPSNNLPSTPLTLKPPIRTNTTPFPH